MGKEQEDDAEDDEPAAEPRLGVHRGAPFSQATGRFLSDEKPAMNTRSTLSTTKAARHYRFIDRGRCRAKKPVHHNERNQRGIHNKAGYYRWTAVAGKERAALTQFCQPSATPRAKRTSRAPITGKNTMKTWCLAEKKEAVSD